LLLASGGLEYSRPLFFDLIGSEQLAHVSGGASLHRHEHFGMRPFRTHDDIGRLCQACSSLACSRIPSRACSWYFDIRKDQANRLLFERLQCFHTVAGLENGAEWNFGLT
jgi:hypothetical protein